MGHKPKLYFVVGEGGILRELFNVRNRKQNGLVISPRLARMEESKKDGLPDREYLERHYSVHPTKDGQDTTITQKTAFRNGSTRSCAAYIHNTRDRFLWPVYIARQYRFTESSKIHIPHHKNDYIVVADYHQGNNTLIYTLFVASNDFSESNFTRPGYWVRGARFERYSLFVIYSFLHVPPYHVGETTNLFTSTPRDDDYDHGPPVQLYTKSLDPAEAEKLHRGAVERMAVSMERRLLAEIPDLHARYPKLNRLLNIAYADPLPFGEEPDV